MYNIGIIGNGVVGKATLNSFKKNINNVYIYDKFGESPNTIEEVATLSNIIFICVPTPTNKNYQQSSKIIDNVVHKISRLTTDKIIVIKSTILPGTTRKLSEKYQNLKFVFCPEFLTEKNSLKDSENPDRVIIGCEQPFSVTVNDVYELHKSNFKCMIHLCRWEEAELVKYVGNSFLAMKVIFSNVMNCVCQHLDIEWESVRNMWIADTRVGKTHTDVPGHDGDYGYGGKCFPKDVKALIGWMRDNKINSSLFETIDSLNDAIRQEK